MYVMIAKCYNSCIVIKHITYHMIITIMRKNNPN